MQYQNCYITRVIYFYINRANIRLEDGKNNN